jgi:hypothetical protein
MTVNSPYKLTSVNVVPVYAVANCPTPPQAPSTVNPIGWYSTYTWAMISKFNVQIQGQAFNENFTNVQNYNNTNWSFTANGSQGGAGAYQFTDYYCFADQAPLVRPNTTVPQNPLTTSVVDSATQTYSIGTNTVGGGVPVQTQTLQPVRRPPIRDLHSFTRKEPIMRSLLCLLLLSAPVARAVISSEPPDTPTLFGDSDLVCPAEVVRIAMTPGAKTDSQGNPLDYTAVIAPRSCYKGSPGNTVNLSLHPADPSWGAPFRVGDWELFFLKEGSQGLYRVLDASGAPPPKDPTGEQLEGGGLERLEADQLEVAATAGPAARDSALGSLGRFPSLRQKSIERINDLHWESDPDLSFWKMLLVAKSGVPGSIGELAKALLTRDESRQVPGIVLLGPIISQQSSRLDLPALEAITRSPYPPLRMDAMLGIRRIKDPGTVPFLVEQLDSEDSDVQYEAVITLAEMTGRGGEYGPSWPTFLDNPEKYKSLWRKWAAEESSPPAIH